MTDDEMIEHYSRIAEDNGGKIKAKYINGICFMVNDDVCYEYQGDEISIDPFNITSIPHSKRVEGFPLNTISMEIKSGHYFYDLKSVDKRGPSKWEKGILNFFQKSLDLTDYNI
jgi:8-oxo-dGTP diphosphatase